MEEWEIDLAVKLLRSGRSLPSKWLARITTAELLKVRAAAGLSSGPPKRGRLSKARKRRLAKAQPIKPPRPPKPPPAYPWPDLSGDPQVEADIEAYALKHHADVWGPAPGDEELEPVPLTEDVLNETEPFMPMFRCACGRRSRTEVCSTCDRPWRDYQPDMDAAAVVRRVKAKVEAEDATFDFVRRDRM